MKNDLTNLDHLRQTALEARGLIGEVAAAAAKDIDAVMPQALEVTLPTAGWEGAAAPYSQPVAAPGVLAEEGAQLIQIVPSAAGRGAWKEAGAECSGQGAGTLTFTAQEKPAGNIRIFVVLQALGGEANTQEVAG